MTANLTPTEIAYGLIALAAAVLVVALLLRARRRRRDGEPGPREEAAGGEGRRVRLGIVSVHELDERRHLVLLRRDGVEHLLLLGGPNDLVVESGIRREAEALALVPAAAPVEVPRSVEVPRPVAIAPSEPRQGSPEPGQSLKDPERTARAADALPEAGPGLASEPAPAAREPAQAGGNARRPERGRGERGRGDPGKRGPRIEPTVPGADPAKVGGALVEPLGAAVGVGGADAEDPSGLPPATSLKVDLTKRAKGSDAAVEARPPSGAAPADADVPGAGDPKERGPTTPPPGRPVTASSASPFSVEEIEAEFARLLGRPLDKAG